MSVSKSVALSLSASSGSLGRFFWILNCHTGTMDTSSCIEFAGANTGLRDTYLIRVCVAIHWIVLRLVGLLLPAFILDCNLLAIRSIARCEIFHLNSRSHRLIKLFLSSRKYVPTGADSTNY